MGDYSNGYADGLLKGGDLKQATIDTLSEERDSFQRVGIQAMEREEKAEVLSKTLHDVNFKQAATIMSIKGARSAFWIQLADIFDLDIRDDTISLVDHIQACSDQNDTLTKENEETKRQHNLDLDDYMESYIRLEAENAALTKENERLRKQNAEQDALLGNPAVPIDSGGFNLVSKLSESEAENTALTKRVEVLREAICLAGRGELFDAEDCETDDECVKYFIDYAEGFKQALAYKE